MRKHTHSRTPAYNFLPEEPHGFDLLAEIAMDLRWSWNHAADDIWKKLDPKLWELTNNPWVVLQTVSTKRLKQVLAEPDFKKKVEELKHSRNHADSLPGWFQKKHAESKLDCIAYFSMEFMLSEALPIYSGGLGNVAGDQLKAASDLGVPVIGVGLLYQQGYFRQVVDKEGIQHALYPYNDPGQLPITPLRQSNGEWLRLEVILPGYSVWLRAWQVNVGRVKLYLLDSNDAANIPIHRGITSELYGGGPELRLQQELLLGIGGWRLLKALGLNPNVCHLNEGHAAFAVLERAYNFMEESNQPFNVALSVIRAGNLFTTHTAVAAGFDRFKPDLIEQYLGEYAQKKLGISVHDLLALGRQNPDDPNEAFNMAYLAIHGSGAVNGVSRLHGKVSRDILSSLFPRWPEEEVPIGYVTNGIHIPSWDSEVSDKIWTEASGSDRWVGNDDNPGIKLRKVSDAKIWKMRNEARKLLIGYARERLTLQLTASGAPQDALASASNLFNPEVLTLGFARRFATYKRPNLLLHNPERLLRILTNPQRPVQLILAGKAHPADQPGQDLIHQWVKFIRESGARSNVIFLSDYDMLLTEQLAHGIDIWINTPRRPWEASGTSGMKVLVNGALNVSELDGWWAEAYTPEVGWAIGDGLEHGDDPEWDAIEANMLYDRLEKEIIPAFYTRDKKGIPVEWVDKVRESMAELTPQYSADRTVREYTEKFYLPASKNYTERAAKNGAKSKKIVESSQVLSQKWNNVHFGECTIKSNKKEHAFELQVYLNDIDSSMVKVELYAIGTKGNPAEIHEMNPSPKQGPGSSKMIYLASVKATRDANDYTARLIPSIPGISIPLELNQILWQR